MIGFRHNRPILRFGKYYTAEYKDSWLSESLDCAAQRAGTTLPFKEDLLSAIRYYLEHECDLAVMSADELFRRIRHMLCGVGLSHLAKELTVTLPPVTVSVAEIAHDVPFWLFFDGELRRRMASLRAEGVTCYRFTGKKECVLVLQGSKRWNQMSQRMMDDLDFILSRYEETKEVRISS